MRPSDNFNAQPPGHVCGQTIHWVCSACGAEVAPRITPLKGTTMGATWQIATCPACGTGTTLPIPAPTVIEAFYAAHFDYRWYRDHLWAKQCDAAQRAREIVAKLGSCKKVLDFGGGLGYQSAALRTLGLICDTWDPYSQRDKAPPAPASYEAIVSLHVLEHAPSPEDLLAQMATLLGPKGELFLAVPNRCGLGYQSLDMAWVWAQPPICHIHHFTPEGLRLLLVRAGFEILETGYTDRWDANTWADIKLRPLFEFLGKLWGGVPILSRWTVYRRTMALLTFLLRFACLRLSAKESAGNDAELWVHAIRRD